MATKAKPKSPAARRSGPARSMTQNKSKNPTKIVVIPKSFPQMANKAKRKVSNPTFFNQNVPSVKVAEYVAGGLIGLTVNRALLPALPAMLVQSNFGAFLTAVALAAAEWWAFGLIDKNFGAAVGFGALMGAGSQGLNSFLPSVGSQIPISGGTGDLVPGKFTVPQNPITDAITGGAMSQAGGLMSGAYPVPYGNTRAA